MTDQLYEKLGWDEPTQAILRTLSRGDLSILQGAVAHSRCELENQKDVQTENGYFPDDRMTFMTSDTPISKIYAHLTERGWMESQPVDPKILEALPTTRNYGLTDKGRRLLGQLLAYFFANNPMPPAPGETT